MSNNRSLSNDATLNDEKAKPSDQNMNNIESIKTELLKPKKPRDLYERSHTQVKRLENKNNTPKMNWRWQITNRPITRDGRMQKDRAFVLESKEDCIGTTLCLLYTDSELGRSFGEFCSNNNQQPETTYLPQSYLNQTHQLQKTNEIRSKTPDNIKKISKSDCFCCWFLKRLNSQQIIIHLFTFCPCYLPVRLSAVRRSLIAFGPKFKGTRFSLKRCVYVYSLEWSIVQFIANFVSIFMLKTCCRRNYSNEML